MTAPVQSTPLLSRLVRQATEHKTMLIAALFGVIAPLIVFAAIAEDVWRHEPTGAQARWLEALHAQATPMLDVLMLAITNAGDVKVLGSLVLVALLGLWFARFERNAIFLAVAVGGAAGLNVLLKHVFQRPRPHLWITLIPENDFGFPSGHAMGSFAIVAALIVLAWPTRWRWAVIVLGLGFTLAVGFSRLYLGVHFPSDVIAGFMASLAWVMAVSIWLRPELFKFKPLEAQA